MWSFKNGLYTQKKIYFQWLTHIKLKVNFVSEPNYLKIEYTFIEKNEKQR